MPVKSAKQYGLMQAAAHGKSDHPAGPGPELARKFLNETPASQRSGFAKTLATRRRNRNAKPFV